MRLAIVAIIVPALCMAVQAQEAKPCPSGHICPICTEQDGVRSCKVERPGQQLGTASSGGAAGYLAAERCCVVATSAAAPPGLSPRPVCHPVAVVAVVAVIAPPTPLLSFFVTARRGWRGRRGEVGTER